MRDLVLDLLAGYRLTRVVLDDSRDFPPLAPLRRRAVKALAPHEPWTNLLDCQWCSSFWIGLGVVAARRAAPKVWRPLAFALAASAVAGLLTDAEERLVR